MARLLMRALERAGHTPELASRLRTRDGTGDPVLQNELAEKASEEASALVERMRASPPDVWFTYHCYYKAPDLVGPQVCSALQTPYVIAEASRAKKRLVGPWAHFAKRAEAAIDTATIVFSMSSEDRVALDAGRLAGQRIYDLPPFLEIGPEPQRKPGSTLRLLCVGMMRGGAKLRSYQALAAALAHLDGDWRLSVVGDGEKRADVEALFAEFSGNVTFLGMIDNEVGLRKIYAESDVFVWPGIEEAYGMVYLEAQAAGLPVVAEDHPGPANVLGPGCARTPVGDPEAFANAIRAVIGNGREARRYVRERHSLDSAATILRTALAELA